MKTIKEYQDGFRWVDGDTSSVPFEKDSDIYNELIAKGCKVELIPKAKKDAHKKEQDKAAIIQKLAALDLPPHTLAMAVSGDEIALKKLTDNEALKVTLREELAAIK